MSSPADEKPAWRASTPWVDDRPRALAVCCSDGRWHEQFEEFIRADISVRADVYAVPGGAVVFDAWASSFEEARAADLAVRFLIKNHQLESIWLISHEGCAWYRIRHSFLTPDALAKKQVADLRSARAAILRNDPKLDVRLFHATLDGSTVVMNAVAPG